MNAGRLAASGPGPRRGPLGRWLAAALAPGLSACVLVQVNNGSVQTRLLPGVAVVHVQPAADQLSLVRLQGLGLTVSQQQATLGWLSQTHFLAQGPQACGTFIVAASAQDMRALQQWLLDGPLAHLSPCVLNLNPEPQP